MKNKFNLLSNSSKSTVPPSLHKLVNHLRSFLLPQQIFAIRHPGSEYTALLLVLEDDEPGPCTDPAATVQRMHSFHPLVNISLHKTSMMRLLLQQGHPFYSRVCTPAFLIYNNGAAALPLSTAKALSGADAYAKLVFYTNEPIASSFLQMARHALAAKNYTLTLFMLHQCAELMLRAVNLAFIRQEGTLHSVTSLLHHVRRFAPALLQPFSPGGKHNQRLLQLLDKAYNDARYDAGFTASAADTKLLIKKVERLRKLAGQLFSWPEKDDNKRYRPLAAANK